MSDERQMISEILGIAVRFAIPQASVPAEAEAARRGDLILVRMDDPKKIVAIVGRDDLFDGEGNLFYSDI